MHFESWAAFWDMGGYGPYVWSCYLLVLLALGIHAVMPWLQRKQLIAQIRRQRQLQEIDDDTKA